MDINDPHRPPTESELTDVNEHWEDENRDYDPNRGDHVDHLNDTTPPPAAAPKQKRKHGKRWPWVLLVILLLLAGGAAYYHFGMKKAAAPAKTTKTTQAATQTVAPVTIKTKHYDSSTFLLGLDYPEDWELSDTDAKLTITSPGMTLKDITGKNVSARVQVMIRSRQTTVPEFATGPGTAVLESEKISYLKPTQNQRAQTYVSFVSYASDKLNGLDALYVAGDNGYQSGQSIPMTDVLQTDPLINVNFLNCDTDCAKTTTALSLSPSDWKSETLAKPITTILTSLTLN